MKTIIYDENIKAISSTNPLAVRTAYDADDSFIATLDTPDARTAQTVKAATSGKSIYVTDVVISTAATVGVSLEDGNGTVKMAFIYMTANYPVAVSFSTPIKITVSTALKVKASAYGEVAITVTGYVA